MARFRPLMLLLSIPRAFGVGDACNSSAVTSLPPFVDHKTVRKGQGEMIWSFPPPAEDFAIVLTPSNSSVNPDMRLYMASTTTACQPMLNSQELGADYMRLGRNLTEHWNVSVYFLHVTCRDEERCRYHLAFSKFEEWEEMAAGEQRSAIAYHGVPLHFKFLCTAECANASEASTRRITFSAWPRDASSLRHLSLLVRRGDYPTTNAHEHINASRGWFSGEVVSTTAKAGTYYVTVLKRHGLSPLPFAISVSLPSTIETLQLGKPTFGAAQKGVPSFYKFYVPRAETDIEVYLTKLDGDPDCAVSHQQENERPTLSKSQWRSAKAGDDEISIPPADPERKRHQTGWFHVGVHSLSEDSTFSIIAFAESHVEQAADTEQGKDGYMIQWTELWMGLPQAMAAQPGRPANFLYYSQLAAPKLFVNIEAIEGNKPDVCVQNCGEDPHRCPWISIFASETTRASAPDTAVSFCGAGSLRGYAGDEQVTILKPCTKCWYTVLVTSALKRSRFKIQLGAEGRAHPLVEGESFKGHADSGDECPVLAYDLVESEIESRTAPDATLQISMTPIYGEPVFDVRKDSEEGTVLFNSSGAGHDLWELKLSAELAKAAAGIYYVQVCAAGPQHAQFRITVAWDKPLLRPGSAKPVPKKLGVAMLNDGEVQMGSISAKKHDVYLFIPASVEQSPTIRVSVTSVSGGCKLYVLAPRTGSESKAKEAMRAFLQNPAEVADWTTAEQDSSEIVISPSDAKYIAPTSSNLYVFLVSAETDTEFEIAASTGGVEELLTTGLPLRGEVARGEYRRYRVSIAEAGRHLSIQLTAENGDCDLYVHIVPDVSSESFVLRSENVGSDSIFVDAFSELNQMHCGEKMIRTYGECVYFVAIKGISPQSAYQLQAIVPAALPLPLTMSTSRAVTLPPGGIQYFYTLAERTRSTLIEVEVQSGALNQVAMKVMPLAEAKHPNASKLGEVDMTGTFFAGVWSLMLEPTRLSEKCTMDCTILVVLKGEEVLTTCAISYQPRQTSEASVKSCRLLEAGVPSRGVLAAKAEKVCYNLRIPDDSDVAITVSPLTDCRPTVEVTQMSGATKMLPADAHLGFVSSILRHEDGEVQKGLLSIEVSSGAACQFDVRAQMTVGKAGQVSAGLLFETKQVLRLDVPAFFTTSRNAGAHSFTYTSQIQTPKETASREFLQVEVMALSGEISVRCACRAVPAATAHGSQKTFVSDALKALHQAEADLSKGSSQIYTCRGMREACGEAFTCLILLVVESKIRGWEADYVVMAVDRRTREMLLPGVAVERCVGQLCAGGRSSIRYQLYINNPSTKVSLRFSCQGRLRQERCSQVLLSADARTPMPASLADRAYTPHEAAAAGYISMELRTSVEQERAHPGHCRVPCALTVQVELRPGEYAAVDFQLEAVFEDAYSVVLDGGKPLHLVAAPGKPEYFLFNTRQQTSMSTLAVQVPYDASDPEMDLVKMFLMECGQDGKDSSIHDSAMPSQQSHSQRGVVSSRWQLMAMVAHRSESTGSCHGVTVAIISHRTQAVPIAIRGYGWHPGTPLMLGDPLEAVLDGSRKLSYEVVPDESVEDVVLDLEVCAGNLRLQTGIRPGSKTSGGAGGHDLTSGGISRLKMPLKMNEWVQISSADGRYARYVLTVQDAADVTWLDAADLQRSVLVVERSEGVHVDWRAASLFGQGHDVDPRARYEVFYGRRDKLSSNISTACGLYLEHSLRNARRIVVDGATEARIEDLQAGHYVVNVVARSLATGHVVAYQPWVGDLGDSVRTTGAVADRKASSGFWPDWPLPILVLVGSLVAWQLCKGSANRLPPFSLELPPWRSSPQHYQSLDGREIGGRYMPPAIVEASEPERTEGDGASATDRKTKFHQCDLCSLFSS
ncbi:unnamed protein product [Symbiodinium sp. CCMP2456]|nr:unnamed protein product [Symbiodinium sp. CCMP2456]